jgi:hypothetical protein
VRASIVRQWHSIEFDRVLRGRQFILFVQETDLERREEKLANDQAQGLYPFDGRNMSLELEGLHEHVAGVEDDHVNEGKQLSRCNTHFLQE